MLDVMRLALALVLVAGCLPPPSDPPPSPDPYDGWTGPAGDPLDGCAADRECSPQVCARDRSCYPASSIYFGHVAWTINGKPASDATCVTMPKLTLRFRASNGESFGFAPVPCKNGEFSVDKMPKLYTSVELGPQDSISATTASIDSETGEAMVLLP